MAKKSKEVKNVQEKESEQENEGRSCFSCVLRCCLISTAVVTAIASILAYQVYAIMTTVPPLPDIDLNEYWGPNHTEVTDTSIRPYRIVFTDSMQEEIRQLFEMYRRNTQSSHISLENAAWTYGVNSDDFAEFMTDWIFEYSFRERAKFLNKFDHFKTNVQGLDLHFMHVKPDVQNKKVKVVPLLLLHGWPGSIREFYETIPRLTTAKKRYNFVFEVIVPSLPGFVYSEGASRPGMSPVEIAVIMRNLMHRIGHKKFYVQGGDFGHVIGSHMATIFPDEVLGFHTNFPANFSKYASWAWLLGSIWPSFVGSGVEDRMYPLVDKVKFYMEESGYMHLQTTKPDTIGIALQDSAVGLAAYILDRFMIFTDPQNKHRTQGGLTDKYDTMMVKLLDNIMLYWDSRCITTSMRLYKESVLNDEVQKTLSLIPTPVPTWALRTKHELVQHSDYLLSFKYNLVGSTTLETGGHFAAFEKPKTFADDVFKAVNKFLKVKKK